MKGIFKPGPILKNILLMSAICFVLTLAANAQCVPAATDACVQVHQSILDRAAKALDELTEARKTIAAFQNERSATDIERAAYKNALAAADTAIAVLNKGIADRDALIAVQDKALRLFSDLVDKISAQLNRPKSAWQKFIGAVEKVAVLLAGVAIGRAGL